MKNFLSTFLALMLLCFIQATPLQAGTKQLIYKEKWRQVHDAQVNAQVPTVFDDICFGCAKTFTSKSCSILTPLILCAKWKDEVPIIYSMATFNLSNTKPKYRNERSQSISLLIS